MRETERLAVMGEYAGARFGDARVDERLQRIISKVMVAPGESFPEQMETDADQEALYRFLRNPKVTMEALLEGHRLQTLDRIGEHRLVRIVHDTTEFRFEGEREGLGLLRRQTKGFLAHFALAVSPTDGREPLGVMAVRPFVNKLKSRGLTPSQATQRHLKTPRAEKKSSRWEKLAIEVSSHLPAGTQAIHLMDQEADDYHVMCALVEEGLRFVVRGEPRRYTADGRHVKDALARRRVKVKRNVPVARRSKKQSTRQHPVRRERVAKLDIRAGSITFKRPTSAREASRDELQVNAVHVLETSPPEGETAIEWMLFTSEPIETSEQVEEIIDHYQARWVIEEYFKALKTGCAFEKRQLSTLDGLLRALGLLVPMAWSLLSLRTLGRESSSQRKATKLFSPEQLKLLSALLKKRRKSLPPSPTVRDAMLGIAALGGHIPNNGDPGWLVLGRGMRRFAEAEEVLNILQEM